MIGDPFDRMLVAQKAIEQLVPLTADSTLARFPCRSSRRPSCVDHTRAAFTYLSQPDDLPLPDHLENG